MELELFNKITKLPFITDGKLIDGSEIPQNKFCNKCRTFECTSLITSGNSELICNLGFNSILIKLKNKNVILNGLILDDNKEIKEGRKKARKEHLISRKEIETLKKDLKLISECIDEGIKSNIRDRFSLFHDVKSSYGVAFANVESIILQSPGNSFYEKLQNCDQKIVDLYDGLDLVNSQLELIDVIVNPAAIVQGSKKEMNLYKLSDKLSKLFTPKSNKKRIQIRLESNTQIPDGTYHDSIKLIPIILIENAIKYSENGSQIILSFRFDNKLQMTVSSYGRGVPENEREKIFRKQFRGSNTEHYEDKGIGMGLYTAQNILVKHEGIITYEYEQKSGMLGFNKFHVTL